MAYQKAQWFCNDGSTASSKLDAEMGDAWAAVVALIEKFSGTHMETEIIRAFLDNRSKELLPLLSAYLTAAEAREKEVMS